MLERLNATHAKQLAQLEIEIFPHPWKEEDFLFEFEQNPFAYYFGIFEQSNIIAYIGCWLKDENVEITNVGVLPIYQGQGKGQQLLQQCIDHMIKLGAKVFTLEVRQSNRRAIALYEKFNFKTVALRKNYYTDTNEDAYLMMMEVK